MTIKSNAVPETGDEGNDEDDDEDDKKHYKRQINKEKIKKRKVTMCVLYNTYNEKNLYPSIYFPQEYAPPGTYFYGAI